jgi:hypothetical protein
MAVSIKNVIDYIYIVDGKMRIKALPNAKGAACRLSETSGKEIWEYIVSSVYGTISDFKLKKNQFTNKYEWRVYLSSDDGNSCLQIAKDSKIARQFITRIPNIQEGKKITIETGKGVDKENGKDYHWLKIYHGTREGKEDVKPFYSRTNMPQPKETIEGWDYAEQNEFITKVAMDFSEKYGNNNQEYYEKQDDGNIPEITPEDLELPANDDMPF